MGPSLPNVQKTKTLIRLGECPDFSLRTFVVLVLLMPLLIYVYLVALNVEAYILVWTFTCVPFGGVRVETAHLHKFAGAVAGRIIDKCIYQNLINYNPIHLALIYVKPADSNKISTKDK